MIGSEQTSSQAFCWCDGNKLKLLEGHDVPRGLCGLESTQNAKCFEGQIKEKQERRYNCVECRCISLDEGRIIKISSPRSIMSVGGLAGSRNLLVVCGRKHYRNYRPINLHELKSLPIFTDIAWTSIVPTEVAQSWEP